VRERERQGEKTERGWVRERERLRHTHTHPERERERERGSGREGERESARDRERERERESARERTVENRRQVKRRAGAGREREGLHVGLPHFRFQHLFQQCGLVNLLPCLHTSLSAHKAHAPSL
jgi:hypothetical protein